MTQTNPSKGGDYSKPEIWKPVVGYEGLYEVSSHGNVKSLRSGKILKPTSQPQHRYKFVSLRNAKGKVKPKSPRIHRLVAEAFIPNPENKPQVNHKNGDRIDNHVDNLEWATGSENILHSYDHLKRLGPTCKLTVEQVREIKKLLAQGMSQRKIAAQYGLTQGTIWFINVGRNWRRV